jgi:hypothetical protein
MAPPSIVGAVVGAILGDDVPERALYAAIAAVLVWSGVDLVWRPLRKKPDDRLRLWPAVVFGFVIGLVGGAVGVILGTLRMPALLRGVRMRAARAVGTNLVVGFLLGVAAFVAQAVELDIDWSLLAAGLAGAIPGGYLGARLTGLFSETALRRAVGATLVAVGVAFAVQAAAG